jgi:hypothetical protein
MPKAKHQITDEERSRRFIEKARELGADTNEAVEKTDRALRRIVKAKEPPKPTARRPASR